MNRYKEFLSEWHDYKDYIICHTSGSTGAPKEIRLSKERMKESAERTNTFFNLDSGSHFHSCISPEYIGGKMMAVRADILNAGFSFEPPSNRPLTDYQDGPIDLLAVVPSQMQFILDHPKDMPEIRNIIIGGSAIPAKIRERIAASGLNAFETYGMTETCSHVALRKIERNQGPFSTMEGITVRQIDSRLAIKISTKDGNQEFITNDLADIIDNRHFIIMGRADNVINSGGIKIIPEKIENLVESEFNTPVLVYGERDEKWGQRAVMIVDDDHKTADKDLIDFLKGKLRKEWIPKKIIHGKLPMTSNGKKLRSWEDIKTCLSFQK